MKRTLKCLTIIMITIAVIVMVKNVYAVDSEIYAWWDADKLNFYTRTTTNYVSAYSYIYCRDNDDKKYCPAGMERGVDVDGEPIIFNWFEGYPTHETYGTYEIVFTNNKSSTYTTTEIERCKIWFTPCIEYKSNGRNSIQSLGNRN